MIERNDEKIFYRVYWINPVTDEVDLHKDPLNSNTKIFRALNENHIDQLQEPKPFSRILSVFLANHFEFYKLKYFTKLVELVRETSSLDKRNEITTTPIFSPVLTLYSSESLMERVKRNRKFGINYWDTSIWQRWVDVHSTDYENNLQATLSDLLSSFKKNIYAWPVANEHCDFFTRVYKNSYIMGNSTGRSGSHAGDVVPFPFFHESEFQKNIESGVVKKAYDFLKEIKWRILVIDDKADTKIDLIRDLLSRKLGVVFRPDNLVMDKAADKTNSLAQLRDSQYDIILMDYLLGGSEENRELSIDILKDLQKPECNDCKRGPDGKFWIFGITSFASSFIDHMREDKLRLNNNIWTMDRGADPINTPNTFIYNLINFLEIQLDRFRPADKGKAIVSIWNKSLLQLDESSPTDKKPFSREWATKTLIKILNYWSHIESLKEIKTSSLFADSFLKSSYYSAIVQENESELYGYLAHFLYMLSFSDGYQWEEMKADLQAIRQIAYPSANDADSNDVIKGYNVLNNRIELLQRTYDR